jgi:hypothetical protein
MIRRKSAARSYSRRIFTLVPARRRISKPAGASIMVEKNMALHLSLDPLEPVGSSMLPTSRCRPDGFIKGASGQRIGCHGASAGSETTQSSSAN